MRKLFLLTKTLLVVALLGMGNMRAWAQTTITYDFQTYAKEKCPNYQDVVTITLSGTDAGKATGSNTCKVINDLSDFSFGGKLAFQTDNINIRNNDSDSGEAGCGLVNLNSGDRQINIRSLSVGDKLTFRVFDSSAGSTLQARGTRLTYEDNGTQTIADWHNVKSNREYTVTTAGDMAFVYKNRSPRCYIYSIQIVTNTTETVTAPEITSVSEGDGRRVTINKGVSNLLSGVTTYYTTNGTTPTSSSTVYTEPFLIEENATIKAITISNSSALTVSTVASHEINLSTVEAPSYEITGPAGISRKFTLSAVTDGSTLYYSTTELAAGADGWTEYTTEVTTDAATIYAYAKKGSTNSEVISFATGAGTEVTLIAPTISKPYYDMTASTYCATITSDQSSLGYTLTETIVYYTSADATEHEVTSGVEITGLPAGVTLYAKVSADGYASPEDASKTLNSVFDIPEYSFWEQSFLGVTSGTDATVTMSTEYFTVNGTNYNYMTSFAYSGTTVEVNPTLGFYAGNWMVRNKNGVIGLYNNGGDRYIGIKSLKKNQVVEIVMPQGSFVNNYITPNSTDFGSSYFFTKNSDGTYSGYFKVNSDGTKRFNTAKYVQIYKIKVLGGPTETPSVTDYATYSSTSALDFAHATGVKAYYASGSDGSTVSMEKVTSTVAASTGLLLQKTEGTISIPTVYNGTDVSSTNLLKAGTGAAVKTDGNTHRYVLAGEGASTAFYELSESADAVAIPAGKAYLEVVGAGARLNISFSDDETSGIVNVEKPNITADGVYNLNGQRVANPTKGLYIVNGKKVIRK